MRVGIFLPGELKNLGRLLKTKRPPSPIQPDELVARLADPEKPHSATEPPVPEALLRQPVLQRVTHQVTEVVYA